MARTKKHDKACELLDDLFQQTGWFGTEAELDDETGADERSLEKAAVACFHSVCGLLYSLGMVDERGADALFETAQNALPDWAFEEDE